MISCDSSKISPPRAVIWGVINVLMDIVRRFKDEIFA